MSSAASTFDTEYFFWLSVQAPAYLRGKKMAENPRPKKFLET
ncbi:hypothetical protein LEP1GSC047_4177 [Leptospira inadai serovar Lyme str. 10]|uniref:Uncharacterized protein n=1 Tax=Leptospira inadai serovar Lyme str. 10 TaxID=1049790 RepID=V6HDQ2_9LEPT|nr:hypothetical protein LEP1GSC047_4177 [Leptospira inadai serovar Lyme str. 10]